MRPPTRLGVALLAACVAFLPALAQESKPAPDDLKRLQGAWRMVSGEGEGIKLPAVGRWVFKGEAVQCGYTADDLQPMGTVKLDASKLPKQIDLIEAGGAKKRRTMPAIYKFEGDRLVICFGPWDSAHRPTHFVAPPESNWYLVTFERIKE